MNDASTLKSLSRDLESGKVKSRDLLEQCLERLDATDGEGARTFVHVDRDAARLAADAMDKLRSAGAAPSPFAGIPVSIKDLFDIAGQTTRAGSKILADATPATRDCSAVHRLRHAGFVVIGRTNMSEFAYSGVGINPHYGTPRGRWDRAQSRVPGGSSSGAAVSVADGMAHAALGTDTGGSCRIPAAFNGLVGYKPSAQRVPKDGVFPLSTTLDSIGPIARSVACCASLDAILAGQSDHDLAFELVGRSFAVPRTLMLDGMDEIVARRFAQAIAALERAGARITEIEAPELAELPRINRHGGFSGAESYALHRPWLAEHGSEYDPRVRARILLGQAQSAADYIDLINTRAQFIAAMRERLRNFDGMLCPTVPIVPPRIAELDADADFTRLNGLCLRNPSAINFLDGCSISLPTGAPGDPPVGLMISCLNGEDSKLFAMASGAEKALCA